MALNIQAERKISLKDFAEGWDQCYLTVRAVNQSKVDEWKSQMHDGLTDKNDNHSRRQPRTPPQVTSSVY